ncbi:hypothetical protein PVK06_007488 [Gossypium arboreum]|uniref:Aminotransferase-like plant mobile domain-containing protein n=1 Tax=Gossypium arboreum TaxID=29729 RepID=A0ABR0QHF5_GOSAR|nr:hypothetical protein PVK06_007488 [Gossypium arboreum]
MQLGLGVDDEMVTGQSKVLEPSVVCHRLLGRSPGDEERNFTCLKLAWLKENFKELLSNATKYEVICATPTYIMQLIDGVLMPDYTSNRVHLKYLPLLEDFHHAGIYRWGSVVLVILYRKLFLSNKTRVVHGSNDCYRRGSQPMVEPDPKDQHTAEPDPEDQPLNTHTSLNQWVSAFSVGS